MAGATGAAANNESPLRSPDREPFGCSGTRQLRAAAGSSQTSIIGALGYLAGVSRLSRSWWVFVLRGKGFRVRGCMT